MVKNWTEVAILALLLNKRELIYELNESLFDDPKVEDIYKIIKQYDTDKKNISTRELSIILGKDYKEHLNKLRRYIRSMPDERLIINIIGNKFVKQSFLDVAPDLSRLSLNDFDSLKEAIDRAESLVVTDIGTTMNDYAKEYEPNSDEKWEDEGVRSFLEGVELFPGEVGLIEAIPKGGKTVSLVNIGAIALVHGLKVYHWSLEIPKSQLFSRYAARISGSKYEMQSAQNIIKRNGGELVVRDEPYCTPRDLRSWVLKGKPDLLIVDYADLMTAPKKNAQRRFEIRDTYLGLRNIAKEFHIPLWTASQATAKGKEKLNKGHMIDETDLEEAKIVKAGICALILSLNQTPEEKEEGLLRVNLVLSTHGYNGSRRASLDYIRQHVKEIDKE
jgi:replicative DNA helicase